MRRKKFTGLEPHFERAIRVARRQQARSLELRAVTSLARLYRLRGEPAKGHEVLAAAYEWFTEGFETADLCDARSLLAELESRRRPQ